MVPMRVRFWRSRLPMNLTFGTRRLRRFSFQRRKDFGNRSGVNAALRFRGSKRECVRGSLIVAVAALAFGVAFAQWGGADRYSPEYEACRTAREAPSHSTGTPTWTNEPGFE